MAYLIPICDICFCCYGKLFRRVWRGKWASDSLSSSHPGSNIFHHNLCPCTVGIVSLSVKGRPGTIASCGLTYLTRAIQLIMQWHFHFACIKEHLDSDRPGLVVRSRVQCPGLGLYSCVSPGCIFSFHSCFTLLVFAPLLNTRGLQLL